MTREIIIKIWKKMIQHNIEIHTLDFVYISRSKIILEVLSVDQRADFTSLCGYF